MLERSIVAVTYATQIFRKTFLLAALVVLTTVIAAAQTIDFETPTYTLGNINGQDGWMKTGPYDAAVAATAFPGFGAQTLRVSNGTTSGSFGDQTFSKSLVNEAGETLATNGGFSGGTRQNSFTAQFDLGTTSPGAQQPGLVLSVSPDRGDGGRMSYLRFEDETDGIRVFFADVQQPVPCSPSGCANFVITQIATVDRTVFHTVKFVMLFVDGPSNDVVKIYIDGALVHTGTSWEDYFRYDPEASADPNTHTVDSLLIRAAGMAVPANTGNGFLFDNMIFASSTAIMVDDDGVQCPGALTTINGGITAAVAGQTVHVCPGTYAENVNVNKSVTLEGSGDGSNPLVDTIISPVGGTGVALAVSDITLEDVRIDTQGAGNGIGVTASVNDLAINRVTERNASVGFRVGGDIVLDGLTITDSHFDDNLNQGWYLSEETAPAGTVTDVNVTNTTFNNNVNKGIYAEKLDNAVFNGITVNNSGTGGELNHRAGIDINLKWAAYSNIQILNSTITNSGTGDPNGGGILIKARSTGAYASPAATLDGVTLTGNVVTGNGGGGAYAAGIIVGESHNVLSGIDAGPTNVAISSSLITGNGIHALRNATLATTVKAENNWWGTAVPGDVSNLLYGTIDFTPFLTNGTDANAAPGFQGDVSQLIVHSLGVQSVGPGRIQEGIDLVASGGTVKILGGSYTGNVDTSGKSVTLSPGASPAQVFVVGDLLLDGNDTVAIEINGTSAATQYDNFVVTGAVTLGGAALALTGTYVPVGLDAFTIISNDAADAVTGTFSGLAEFSTVMLNSIALNVSYLSGPSGGGNDVVLSTATGPCITVTTAPHIDSLSNVNVTIPVMIGDTTGRQMTGAQFVFNYDPSILSPNPINISVTNGTVATAPLIAVNNVSPGVIQVSISTTSPFVGTGPLVNLNMKVVGPIGSTTPTDLTNVLLFKVGPQQIVCSTVIDSDLTVISASITGNVTYKLERFAQPTAFQPVPLASITAIGPTPPAPSITDALGNYTMTGFSFGSYSLSPSKPDKACGLGPFNGIGSNDATLIARSVVFLDTLSTDQQEAAMVANLGFVNSLDASLVARFAVCIPTPGSLAGQWRFKPLFAPAPGPINTVSGGDYDYYALLMGDVTGDWSSAGPLRPGQPADPEAVVRVQTPRLKARSGSTVTVPVSIDNLRGQALGSYQFDITYDPEVVEPADIAAELTGTMGESLNIVSNSPMPGLLKVAVYGILPVTGDGVYANLKFNVIGAVGSTTPMDIAWFGYNDGRLSVNSQNGSISVVKPKTTAIEGRLVSSTGQGLRNVRVILTNDTGERSVAVTGSFGYFEFGDLTVGRSYTITVESTRFRFTPQTVSGRDGITTIEMIALD